MIHDLCLLQQPCLLETIQFDAVTHKQYSLCKSTQYLITERIILSLASLLLLANLAKYNC